MAPAGAYPEGHVRDAVARFVVLRERLREVSREAARLTSAEARKEAEAQDLMEAVEALKAGEDPGAVGTGHADALAAQAAEATRSEAAFATALEDLWRSEVLPRLREVAEAQAAHWEAERDERADKVRAALREARAAESRWFNAASAVAYWARLAGDEDNLGYGGLGIESRNYAGPSGLNLSTAPLERALDSVTLGQSGGRVTRPSVKRKASK